MKVDVVSTLGPEREWLPQPLAMGSMEEAVVVPPFSPGSC